MTDLGPVWLRMQAVLDGGKNEARGAPREILSQL